MRFPLHARSPNSARFLLIAAISGRALAAAARRAGYRPLVADFFCDTDTVALAERAVKLAGRPAERHRRERASSRRFGNWPEMTSRSLSFWARASKRRPEIVDEIARHFPLAGNSAATIRRVKDPQSLAADCAELGIPHPAFRWEPPADPENWVVKTAGGAGGSHVKRANGDAPATGRYFQRFVSGQQRFGAVHRRRHDGADRRLQPAMGVARSGRALSLWRRGAAEALRPAGRGDDRPTGFPA